MGKYFGTDGFRGEANVTLTADHAYQIGRFLGYYYGNINSERARIVIGKDTRRSSYMLEYALAAGITASGADAYLLHVTTTPSVSFVTRTDGFDCGVMISASHNPFYDNGIKLLNSDGEKMEQSVLDEIENNLSTQQTATQYVETERQNKIGVNLDEELMELIKLQRAYEAAARIFNTSSRHSKFSTCLCSTWNFQYCFSF